jgi:hypothetical protein
MSTTQTLSQALVHSIFGIEPKDCPYPDAVDLLETLAGTDDEAAEAAKFYLESPAASEQESIETALRETPKVGHGDERAALHAAIEEVKAYWEAQATLPSMPELVTFGCEHCGTMGQCDCEVEEELAMIDNEIEHGLEEYIAETRVELAPSLGTVPTLRQQIEGYKQASYLYAAYNGHVEGAENKDALYKTGKALGCKVTRAMTLLGLVRVIAVDVGLEWDIIAEETDKIAAVQPDPVTAEPVLTTLDEQDAFTLPGDMTWDMLISAAQNEVASAYTDEDEAGANLWLTRIEQLHAYKKGDGVEAAVCKAKADTMQAEMNRPAQVDIEHEAHGEGPSFGMLDAPTVEAQVERLETAANHAGVHGFWTDEDHRGNKVFHLPKGAVLWLFCPDRDIPKFKHNSTLTVPKWIKGLGTQLLWRFEIQRIE